MRRLFIRAYLGWVVAGLPLGCEAAEGRRRIAEGAADGGCRQAPQEDPGRARRIYDLLGTTEAGRRLIERTAPALPVRFVDLPDPGITTDGTIFLDPCASDAENAARLGHLLQHAADGAVLSRRDDAVAAANQWTDELVEAEARAILLEIELRAMLGVDNPRRPYPFESEIRAAAPGERLRLLRSRLEALMRSAPQRR